MWDLGLMVLVASLVGSLHCAGMCGAFVAFAVGGPSLHGGPGGLGVVPVRQGPPRWVLNASYNGGRLVTYSMLGAAAGAVGTLVDLGGSLIGVQRVAAVIAGVMLVGMGLVVLLRSRGVRLPHMLVPSGLMKLTSGLHRRASGMPPVWRALTVGLLTTLLPCGWLWAFAVVAWASGGAVEGAVVMAAFWLGTVPILAAIGGGVGALAGRLKGDLAVVMSVAIIAAGLYTIVSRTGVSLPIESEAMASPGVRGVDRAMAQLEVSRDETPACCAE